MLRTRKHLKAQISSRFLGRVPFPSPPHLSVSSLFSAPILTAQAQELPCCSNSELLSQQWMHIFSIPAEYLSVTCPKFEHCSILFATSKKASLHSSSARPSSPYLDVLHFFSDPLNTVSSLSSLTSSLAVPCQASLSSSFTHSLLPANTYYFLSPAQTLHFQSSCFPTPRLALLSVGLTHRERCFLWVPIATQRVALVLAQAVTCAASPPDHPFQLTRPSHVPNLRGSPLFATLLFAALSGLKHSNSQYPCILDH